jgi:hypothetical protein
MMRVPIYLFVIARCAKRAVAIQSLDRLGTLSLSKRLDCFVSRQGGILAMTVRTNGHSQP